MRAWWKDQSLTEVIMTVLGILFYIAAYVEAGPRINSQWITVSVALTLGSTIIALAREPRRRVHRNDNQARSLSKKPMFKR